MYNTIIHLQLLPMCFTIPSVPSLPLYSLSMLVPTREITEILVRLDNLLLDSITKRIKLLPVSIYEGLDRTELRIWCHYRARYLLPTVELVGWLNNKIDGRRAIEIGAGNGDLGYHLGIPAFDNGCQQYENVKAAYLQMGQIPTNPPPDVMRIDAIQAIHDYQPEVAIGAWITDKFVEGSVEGNVYAPDGYQIIQNVEYIRIGTEKNRGRSKILEFPHEIFKPPGMVSRTSASPPDDVIHIWKKLS